jgi:hypothetical protein
MTSLAVRRIRAAAVVVLSCAIGASVVAAQTAARPTAASSVAALWEAPADLPSRDLFNGPWGAGRAPDPRAAYTIVRHKKHGMNPGLVVRDPAGRIWHIKQSLHDGPGAEGPVEVAVSRVLSAVGYHQPPVYFLPSFTMVDENGRTRNESGGRFRLDEPTLRHQGSWSWDHNPFSETRQFKGLLTILLVFNSWDLKDSNNALYDLAGRGGAGRWYIVQDLGGALGESGGLRPKRNNIDKFEHQRFITGVSNGYVEFGYDGKASHLYREQIAAADVVWAMNLLHSLSDRQWHDAFRAGGYTPVESDRFIRKIQMNIAEGLRLDRSTASTRAGR